MSRIVTLVCLLASGVALGQTPTPAPAPSPAPSDDRIVRAEVPIVAGNAVSAKKRALADAFRQATEKAFAELLKDGEPLPQPWPPGVIQIKASLASAAQKYIRSYRLIEQDGEGGVLHVMLEIDVDTVSLRRELDRARGPANVATPAPRPVANSVLTAGPAGAVMVAALNAAGLRAIVDPAVSEAQLVGSATKQNAHALFATSTSRPEGIVRGAARVAVTCSIRSRLLLSGPPGGRAVVRAVVIDRNDEAWGFAVEEAGARNACFERAASAAVRAFTATVRAPAVTAPFVTVQLGFEDVGVIPIVLQALKRMGSVTATEPRHIAATTAELRVFTRIAGPALAQMLVREIGGKLVLEPTVSTNEQIGWRVRNVEPSVQEENR
jgi:hypothetical protein